MRITVFSVLAILLQIAFIIIFGTVTNYAPSTSVPPTSAVFPAANSGIYASFIDLHILVFFALGLMMSMVYRSSFTAAGFSLFLASFSALWGILNYGFWQQAVNAPDTYSKLPINQDVLAYGDYTAATVLVSFGVMLGRISAAQALVMAFWEVIVYNILIAVGRRNFGAIDTGGSTSIFFFGAVYGLVVSAVVARLSNRVGDTEMAYKTAPTSTMAMIGTLFAWCFWPSFNAYFATNDTRGSYSVVNTFMALCASTMLATATTRFTWDGKNRTWQSIYANVSGAVAMGMPSTMLVRPFGALLIGGFTGIFSVLSFRYLQPLLTRLRIPDTVGVFSAFLIPGLVGTIVGIIATAAIRTSQYAVYAGSSARNWPALGTRTTNSSQAALQLAFIALALGLAIVGGGIGGFLTWLPPTLETTYNDAEEWVLVSDELAPEEFEMTRVPK